MKALRNWTDQLDMAEHYSCSKARTSFCIKAKRVRATKETAERVGKKDKHGAWDFAWGDIPVQVPNTESIQERVLNQSLDIIEEAERPQTKLGITVSSGASREGQPLSTNLQTFQFLNNRSRVDLTVIPTLSSTIQKQVKKQKVIWQNCLQ